jgi:hypothetical protein
VTTPTREQVTARLRLAAQLSMQSRASRGLDYSAEAVTSRLREVAEVSLLCARLVEIGAAARRAARREPP